MDTILVVEDSAVSRTILREILSPEYRVEFRENGAEGYDAARSLLPDLVLLDIHLPDIDGIEICRRLKKKRKTRSIPVIFITSLDSEAERVRGFEAGADDYVIKPFYPGELLARIRTHLSARKTKLQEIELERLNLFRELAVAMNHEINNPLTSAYAYLYVLQREVPRDNSVIVNSLQGLQEEMAKIRTLIAKLATASRFERTSYNDSVTMIDLYGLE